MATVAELKEQAYSLSEYLSDSPIETEEQFMVWYNLRENTQFQVDRKSKKSVWEGVVEALTKELEAEEVKVMSEPAEGDTKELEDVTDLLDEYVSDYPNTDIQLEEVDPEYASVKAQEEALSEAYQEAWNEVHRLAYMLSGISFSEPEQLTRWHLKTFHPELDEQEREKVASEIDNQLQDYDTLLGFSKTLLGTLKYHKEHPGMAVLEAYQKFTSMVEAKAIEQELSSPLVIQGRYEPINTEQVEFLHLNSEESNFEEGRLVFSTQPDKPRSSKLNRPYLTRGR